MRKARIAVFLIYDSSPDLQFVVALPGAIDPTALNRPGQKAFHRSYKR